MGGLKYLKSQRGLTLIEILAALVILSVISVLIISIAINSQKIFTKQQSKNLSIAETTIFFNQVLSDVRKYPESVSKQENQLVIEIGNGKQIVYRFEEEKAQIFRDNQIVLNKVTTFDIDIPPDDSQDKINQLKIIVSDNTNKLYETTVTLREGKKNEKNVN